MKNFLEKWLEGTPEHVVQYVTGILAVCDTVTVEDFEKEIQRTDALMRSFEKFSVDFQFYWSIRSYMEEALRAFNRYNHK